MHVIPVLVQKCDGVHDGVAGVSGVDVTGIVPAGVPVLTEEGVIVGVGGVGPHSVPVAETSAPL